MTTTDQLKHWAGEFGNDYTDRNVVDWRQRFELFREILSGLELARILEVGCNRGHNLVTIAELLPNAELVGIEPNPTALEIARNASPRIKATHGNIFQLPFENAEFDLAFTSGVLIHIALQDLPAAMKEIYRVSRKYLMAYEYFAETETMIPYRGHDELLWKRDFPKHYMDRFPDLRVIRNGYCEEELGHWWVFEKSAV